MAENFEGEAIGFPDEVLLDTAESATPNYVVSVNGLQGAVQISELIGTVAVLYTTQSLTADEMSQARANIGAEAEGFGQSAISPYSPSTYGIDRLPYPTLTGTNHVVVTVTGNSTTNGTNLATAYTAAKLLTPGGSALSATNRAYVVLPVPPSSATYLVTAEIVLDTNFVDFIAEDPQNPVALGKYPLETDWFVEASGVTDAFYRPTATIVQSSGEFSTFRQTVSDIRLMGFTIANFRPASGSETPLVDYSSLLLPVNATGNVASHYQDMYFFAYGTRWQNSSDDKETGSVTSAGGVHGTWVDCIASGVCFRTRNQTATFSPQMLRVWAGPNSFANINTNGFDGALFIDCHTRGAVNGSPLVSQSGANAFGEATPIKATCVFKNCSAGPGSFGAIALTDPGWDVGIYGKFYDCVAGDRSFAGTQVPASTPNLYSTFSGLAINCIAGDYSFGGGNDYLASFDPGNDGGGIFTGTLIGCVMGIGSAGQADGADVPIGTISGTMENCRVTSGTFSRPNTASGRVRRCINADGTVAEYLDGLVFHGSTSGAVTIQPAAAAGTYTLTLPTDDGSVGQLLRTDGSGTLSWVAGATHYSNADDISSSDTNPTTIFTIPLEANTRYAIEIVIFVFATSSFGSGNQGGYTIYHTFPGTPTQYDAFHFETFFTGGDYGSFSYPAVPYDTAYSGSGGLLTTGAGESAAIHLQIGMVNVTAGDYIIQGSQAVVNGTPTLFRRSSYARVTKLS